MGLVIRTKTRPEKEHRLEVKSKVRERHKERSLNRKPKRRPKGPVTPFRVRS